MVVDFVFSKSSVMLSAIALLALRETSVLIYGEFKHAQIDVYIIDQNEFLLLVHEEGEGEDPEA